MENFPIYNKGYKLKHEELLRYLEIFPEHSMTALSVEGRVLFSEHHYEDGLRIKVQWIVTNKEVETDLQPNGIHNLIVLWKDERLTPTFCRVLTYSKKKKKKQAQSVILRDTFVQEVLEQNPRRLTNVEYRELEFPTKEKTSLPDAYFEELQTYIANNVLFEQYYNEKEAQSR